jgi:8-oxo-dGTP pyrophosphatase MutT (NUDIX family)
VTRDPNLRQAARAIVVDENDRVAMVKYIFEHGEVRWGTPGGGLDPGESHEEGIRRELHEELGLDISDLDPYVWERVKMFPMLTGHDGQRERYFLVRVAHFDPEPAIGWDRMNAEFVHEIRWWSLDEIESSDEIFMPESLVGHLRTLLRDGPPASPIDVSD